MGIRCADHATPAIRKKLALTSLTCDGHSVGVVRLRTKATKFSLVFIEEFSASSTRRVTEAVLKSSRRETAAEGSSCKRPEPVIWRREQSSVGWEWIIAAARIPQFKASYRQELWRVLPWREGLRVLSYLECQTVIVSVSRSVAGKRLVVTENPSAYATVNCRKCKWEIALYCLCINVVKCVCITQLLTNPIIRTRTCLISGAHVTIYIYIYIYIYIDI
jgi:hypothetical protein